MKKINIVLYSPEIPQNTGNISRTCAVVGAALHIIKPIGFEISDRTLKRAGLDYWDKLEVHYYENYGEFLEKHGDKAIYYFSQKGKRAFFEPKYEDEVFLVFGCESVGLPEAVLRENFAKTLRIPMRRALRCLNLSNAVAVATYEVLRQDGYDGLVSEAEQSLDV